MTLRIEINLGNAAFSDAGSEEVKRILLDLADRLPGNLTKTDEIPLRDVNGNKCGKAVIK